MTEAWSPTSLDDALAILERNPEARLIAGCTDFMVGRAVAERDPEKVVDLLRIPELKGVEETEGGVEIGGTTTFSEIRCNAIIGRTFPALAAAASVVGGWQIQNRATLGGNIVNASPAGDSLPALLALNASVVVTSRRGEREIRFTEFYRGYRETVLEPGELLARVLLPWPREGEAQFFRKVGTREAQAISKVVIALVGRIERAEIVDYRLAAGSVAPTPVRLKAVEDVMIGATAARDLADKAGGLAAAAVSPIDDVRSTAEYRRFVVERVVRRLTLELLDSAR